jgi:hypothetical protein
MFSQEFTIHHAEITGDGARRALEVQLGTPTERIYTARFPINEHFESEGIQDFSSLNGQRALYCLSSSASSASLGEPVSETRTGGLPYRCESLTVGQLVIKSAYPKGVDPWFKAD